MRRFKNYWYKIDFNFYNHWMFIAHSSRNYEIRCNIFSFSLDKSFIKNIQFFDWWRPWQRTCVCSVIQIILLSFFHCGFSFVSLFLFPLSFYTPFTFLLLTLSGSFSFFSVCSLFKYIIQFYMTSLLGFNFGEFRLLLWLWEKTEVHKIGRTWNL